MLNRNFKIEMAQQSKDTDNSALWKIGQYETLNSFVGQVEPKLEPTFEESCVGQAEVKLENTCDEFGGKFQSKPQNTLDCRPVGSIKTTLEDKFFDEIETTLDYQLMEQIEPKIENALENDFLGHSETETGLEVSDWSLDPQTIVDSNFVCDHCKETFRSKYALGLHMSIHFNTESKILILDSVSLKCIRCNFVGSSKDDLARHAASHKGKKVSSITKSSTNKKVFNCIKCGFETLYKGSFDRHTKLHTNSKGKCMRASKTYPKCDQCGLIFQTEHHKCSGLKKIDLKIKAKQQLSRTYKCKHCEYTCTEHRALLIHSRTHDGRPQQLFKCHICDSEFTFENNLKRHIKRLHMKATNQSIYTRFKCDFCDYQCRDNYTLKQHERKHTGEKPYKCNECGFRCKSSSCLKTHSRVHEDVKPYECPHCDFKFKAKFNLKQHIRIHTDEKPYKCQDCDYVCRTSSTLKQHIARHHQ